MKVEYPFSHCLFQFHKGTIKTTREDLNPNLDIRFQFHKGTIKTG